MLLKDYFPNIGKKYEKTFFSDICFESSKVKKDNVFFAIKGTNIDGNNFILDAINKGSKIIVTEKKITKSPDGVLIILSKNVKGTASDYQLVAKTNFIIQELDKTQVLSFEEKQNIKNILDIFEQKNYENSIKEIFASSMIRKLNLELINKK